MSKAIKHKIVLRLHQTLKTAVLGKYFRIYARQSPPGTPAGRLRIAVLSLIPNLGDAVMLFPLLDAIRRDRPEAEISCFTYKVGPILKLHPGVDRVYEMPAIRSWFEKLGPIFTVYRVWSWWRHHLRDLRFDICVSPRGGVDPFCSTHLAWLLGAPMRAGYSSEIEPERESSDTHPDPLLTKCVTKLSGIHEVERGGEVLQLAGLIDRQIEIRQSVRSLCFIAGSGGGATFLAKYPELSGQYGIVAPGASIARRQWPQERFTEIAQREIAARGWTTVFVGGPEVKELCANMAVQIDGRVLNLAGATSFPALAAVCAGAQCFVGNDSGTAHVAGACGVPTLIVSTFALDAVQSHHSSPARSHPIGPYVAFVQPEHASPPCTTECMAEVAHCIDRVENAAVQSGLAALLGARAQHDEGSKNF